MPRRALLTAAAVVALAIAGVARADVVYLRDGTVLRGTVLWMRPDSLAVRTSFGATLHLDRGVVRRVVVGRDVTPSAAPVPGSSGGAGAADSTALANAEPARLVVTFKDRRLSSRIAVQRGHDLEAKLRALQAVELVLVDGDTAFAYVDSTIDKTIYQGPVRAYRNHIDLEDVDVSVPAGRHRVTLVVRNRGARRWRSAFQPRPIEIEIGLGEIDFRPGRAARFHVGIRRSRLGRKPPEFYVVERKGG